MDVLVVVNLKNQPNLEPSFAEKKALNNLVQAGECHVVDVGPDWPTPVYLTRVEKFVGFAQ